MVEKLNMSDIIHLASITEIQQLLGVEKPKHPLVLVIPNHCFESTITSASISTDMYVVAMKKGMSGSIMYGRSTYDFNEGVMVFLGPGQVVKPVNVETEPSSEGWTLIFHPDFIRRTALGNKIHQYSFFSYDVNEALHISDAESKTLKALLDSITKELENSIDKHTESLISGCIELLLDYRNRFYDRQFFTRSNANKDTLMAFESLLRKYFESHAVLEHGLPTVGYCGKELGVSSNYLSDLLKKETGKAAKEHIHLFVMDLAKTKLLNSSCSISEVAYNLGFEYPAHFSKLFKKTTGLSPSEYRKLN